MVKAILFDWHGVLDNITYERFLDAAAKRLYDYDDEFPLQVLRETIVDSELYQQGQDYARGMISPHDFWTLVHQRPLWLGLEEHLLRVDLNLQVWDLMPRLATSYKLAVVSDTPVDKATLITKAIAEQHVKFDPIIYSYGYGRLKIEADRPSLFQSATERLGLPTYECLVVDDSKKNIDSVAQEGFATFHYRNDRLGEFMELIR